MPLPRPATPSRQTPGGLAVLLKVVSTMGRLLGVLLGIWLGIWAGLAVAGASADPVFPPGMRIGLEPPPGMVVSRRFPGFEDAANKAAITLVELPPVTYASVEKSMFDFVPKGMTVEKREMFGFTEGVGIFLSGKSEANGVTLRHWFLLGHSIAGPNADLAALVTVTMPEQALAAYPEKVVRATLASVTFRAAPLDEQLGMLPFKLNDLAGFRVMQAMMAGGVIVIDGPTNDLTRQPYMLISVGQGAPASPDERIRFARDLLSGAPLKDLTVMSSEAMRLSGFPGVEIRATATNLRGNPVKLVQWVRFGVGGFVRIIGVVAPDDWDRLFNRFRAVRDGLALR